MGVLWQNTEWKPPFQSMYANTGRPTE